MKGMPSLGSQVGLDPLCFLSLIKRSHGTAEHGLGELIRNQTSGRGITEISDLIDRLYC